MDPALFLSFVQHQRLIVDYAHIAAGAILAYDYLLTLHLEVKLIWFSSWSYSKVLFLLVRYLAFLCLAFGIYGQTFTDISLKSCMVVRSGEGWLTLVVYISAESILAIRTWAIWNLNKTIGVGLAALMIAHVIIQCILFARFLNSIGYAPSPYSGFRGCLVTKIDRILWEEYIVLTIVESVVLVLMAVSGFRLYKSGNQSKLLHLVHRDGILFYVYLLGITSVNTAVMRALPLDLMILLVPGQVSLYSVLTTRIVLNIREVHNHRLDIELHTGYNNTILTEAPLYFYPGSFVTRSYELGRPHGSDDNGVDDEQCPVSSSP